MAQLFAYASTMSCACQKRGPKGKTAELEPIDGRASDFEQGGDVLRSLALGAEFAGVFSLLGREFGLASEFYPSGLRGLHSGAGALGDQAALEFGQYPDDLPHGAACGRLGVDMLGQGAKLDALGAEVVQHGNKIAQTAAQAVEFPDDKGVTVAQL